MNEERHIVEAGKMPACLNYIAGKETAERDRHRFGPRLHCGGDDGGASQQNLTAAWISPSQYN